jgi:ABC-type Fe3+ transport system substrate-binding protein
MLLAQAALPLTNIKNPAQAASTLLTRDPLIRKQEDAMVRRIETLVLALASMPFAAGLALAQSAAPIEDELTLITPVAKTLTDPALADFAKYAKERWNVTLKTSALAAGTPVAYGQIVEWKGRPQVDIFWGGESALFDKLAEQKLLAKHDLPKPVVDSIPDSIGKPKAIPLKDPKGFWVGTVLEPYGIVYQPKVLQRLGVPVPKDWDDLLNPKLKGNVAQCAPTRSSSSHATYEVILQREGDAKGWEWLKRLGANTGLFTARSRDVPSVVAKGEFAVGFAVPSYMAFEDRLAGFDIRFVAPKTAWITPEPIAVLAGAKHPKAALAFIEYMLSERGQKVAMERGVFPITPKLRVQGALGSTAEMAVEFTGGMRSYFDREVTNIYDDDKAQGRYEAVNNTFRKDIESVIEELKKKY